MADLGAVWSIQWGNPYSSPPEDLPRVRAEVFYPSGHEYERKCPPPLAAMTCPGDGWSIVWQAVASDPKPLSKETLMKVRRKRIERKAKAKYPLFADQIVAEEMAAKPDYYQGITDVKIEATRNESIAAYAKWRDDVMRNPGVIQFRQKD